MQPQLVLLAGSALGKKDSQKEREEGVYCEHAPCLHARDVGGDLWHAAGKREEAGVEDDEHLEVGWHADAVLDSV
jgi:hypothetical protein